MRGSTEPVARAFRTLVGGARRWLRFPLAAPSTGESTWRETDDRRGTSADREVTPAEQETAPANREGTPSGPTGPSGSSDGGPDARGPDGGSGPPANEEDGAEEGDAFGDSSEEPDPDERIRAALAANDGRLRQRDVPAVADLSQSAASRRLIAMEERGEVVRYEIGRGKTVFLPGEEPAAFRSPIEGGDADPATTP